MKATPVARPRSLITGQRMEKIEWGPNWEEILGGEFAKRVEGRQLPRHGEGDLRRVREHLHDVPAAAVRALPQSDVRRVVPLGLDLQARGGRHRADRPGQVPRLADVRVRLPVQEDLLQLVVRQGREVHFCYPRIEAGQPTVCSETCVGRIRYLGVLLYDADRIEAAASVADPKELYDAQLSIFLDPNDPRSDRAGAARRRARRVARGGEGIAGLQDGRRLEGRAAAASRVPDAADGVVRAAAVADLGRGQRRRRSARSASCRTSARCAFRCSTSPTC